MTDLPHPEPAPGGGAGSTTRKWAISCLLLLFGGLAGVLVLFRIGVGVYESFRPLQEAEIPPTLVEVVRVEPRPFEHTVPIAGTLAPIHSVDVFPKVGGKVVALHVGLGDEVREGERLATVESVEYGLQARQAEVGYQMATQAAELAQRSVERLEAVRDQVGADALSLQDYEVARLEAEGAVTQRDLAGLQRDLARRMVVNATMLAPVDGRVTKVNARLGGMVGSEYPAFHVDDLSEFVVRCEVGDLDLPGIRPGQDVRLWTDALADVTLRGTVTAVAPALDAMTRRAPVEISVPNPGGVVVGNLFVRGEIVVAVDPDALVLPVEAVARSIDGAAVQVARDGVVADAKVAVVGQTNGELAITGLTAGELVILPGAEHLAAGEPVEIAEQQPVAATDNPEQGV